MTKNISQPNQYSLSKPFSYNIIFKQFLISLLLLTVLFSAGDGWLAGAGISGVHADQPSLTLTVSLAELAQS